VTAINDKAPEGALRAVMFFGYLWVAALKMVDMVILCMAMSTIKRPLPFRYGVSNRVRGTEGSQIPDLGPKLAKPDSGKHTRQALPNWLRSQRQHAHAQIQDFEKWPQRGWCFFPLTQGCR
jgi:hypothetical protein